MFVSFGEEYGIQGLTHTSQVVSPCVAAAAPKTQGFFTDVTSPSHPFLSVKACEEWDGTVGSLFQEKLSSTFAMPCSLRSQVQGEASRRLSWLSLMEDHKMMSTKSPGRCRPMVISYMHPHDYWKQCWHQAHIPIGLIKYPPVNYMGFFFRNCIHSQFCNYLFLLESNVWFVMAGFPV